MELRKVNQRLARLRLVQKRADQRTRRRIELQEEERALKENESLENQLPSAEAAAVEEMETPPEEREAVREKNDGKKGSK